MQSRKIILLISILTFLLSTNFALAGSSDVGTTTANFLKIGVGARPIGMGGAFVAVSNDANATYWNPAGIMQIQNKQFVAIHTKWFADVSHEFAALTMPLMKDKLAGGISFTYLLVDDIDRRTATGASDGKARVNDFCGVVSFAWKLTPATNLGLNIKAIRLELDQDKGTTEAVDFGILSKLTDNFSLGVNVQNIGPKLNIADTQNKLPFNIKTGIAYRMLNKKLLLAADVDSPDDNKSKTHVGGEYTINDYVSFRAGWQEVGNLGSYSGATAGISFREKELEELWGAGLQFDYAFLYYGDFGYTHRFSITILF